MPSGIEFKRELNLIQMAIIAQILTDLHHRTNDEDNHINFALGDWVIQAEEWFGLDTGIEMMARMKPTPSYSCFISYNHKDEIFTAKLYTSLKEANISVWFAPEDTQGGKKLHEQIDRAIRYHDRLIIVLSDHSLKSEWVLTEIRKARKVELLEKRQKLFPIRLADMKTIQNWECFDSDIGKDLAVEVREYYIPDFSNWEDKATFELSFSRLLDDLKKMPKSSANNSGS
jgi:hypothetical protein